MADTEGTVYRLTTRGNKWHVAYTDIDGRRKDRVSPVQTERGARAFLRKLLTARDNGEHSPARSPTLKEFTTSWLESKRVARCRPRTIEAYRERVESYILPKLGAVKVDKLRPDHITDLYTELLTTRTPRKLSPATVNSVHLALGNMLRLAHRRRLVQRVVTDLVDPPRVDEYEARTLTIAEARAFIAGLQGHEHGPLWLFLLGTGCRFGEAAGLTWENVDLTTGTARIVQQVTRERIDGTVRYVIAPVKTRAGKRTVALPPFVIAALH